MNTPETKNNPELILTGFDPFGEHGLNPSQLVVERFPDEIELLNGEKASVEKQILTTCCNRSWEVLEPILAEKTSRGKEAVLIMLGLADTRSNITMERVALNLRDYPIADNRGHKPPVEKIDPEEENAFFSNLPLEIVSARLVEKGCPVAVSNHAGTFVCNDIFYQSLAYRKKNSRLLSSLFVHLPGLANFRLKTESDQDDDQAKLDCLTEVVKLLAAEVVAAAQEGEEVLV